MADIQELFKTITPNVDENIQPIIDLIQNIMEMPEEALNENTVAPLKELINQSFTPAQRDLAINTLLQSFENSNISTSQIKESIEQVKIAFNSIIEELKPSQYKRILIESIFQNFYDIFNGVLEHYHNIRVLVKLDKGGKTPTYAHDTDACADLYASQDMTIPAHSLSNKVPTGLHIALPENWVMMIDPRSSIGMNSGLRLSNSIGIIDSGYRGEIGVIYDNFSDSDYEIKAGDRVAQCWVQPVYRFIPTPVDILPASDRGEGGFGSTGK